MTHPAWLRRAGRLDAGRGEIVLWSVAEGRRGRRWRSLRLDAEGRLIAGLLVETDPSRRWTRLEVTTAAGLLTLHPEPDGQSVHGNVVLEDGIRHVARRWGSDHRLVVEGEPVVACALLRANPPGAGPGLVVTLDLVVHERDDLVALAPDIGPDGLPGPSWPLELGDAAG